MTIQTMLLDPNAQSYSDDEIGEGTTNKYMVDDDGVVLAINSATDPITREAALSQDDLNIIKTNPAGGEFLVKNIHRDTDGKLQVEYDDTAQ